MNYERISEPTDIQIIARGSGVDIRHYLTQQFGRGNWRKLKGKAIIRYENDEVWLAEIHWYEAHGVGKRMEKVKRKLTRHL